MKTKELVELVRQGVKPVIRVKDSLNIDGPDNGMLGRIISVGVEDVWDRGDSTIEIVIDFEEFEEVNKPLAKKNWYDSNGIPCLTWMESRSYEKEVKSFGIFEMFEEKGEDAELSIIELVEENKWLTMYLETDKQMSYTEFLESRLDHMQTTINVLSGLLNKN
jgi:hypothetical protein